MKTTILLLLLHFYLCCCQSRSNNNYPFKQDSLTQKDFVVDPNSTEYKTYHSVVRDFLESSLLRGHFNGSILVAKNGVIVYENYFGYRNLKTKDTLTAETPMQIASTSKPFTGMAVLRLVQEGRLDLNAPLQQFFPDFPYEGVTVKTLLNHRSGLPEYIYYMDKGGWDRNTYATNNDVLNTLMTWKPLRAFKPDSRFNYCNTNFVLLALIVEKISGMTFPDYMKQTFFEPLKMNNTHVVTVKDTAQAVISYDGYGAPWKPDFSDGPYGDKNIYSTPRDLLKWDQALYNGILINPALMDSAFTPYSNERPSVHNYGFGWRLLMLHNGKKVVYHNGRWHGFNSAFTRLTDEKVTIIILGNRFNRNVYFVARKLYNLFGNYDDKKNEAVE